MVRLCWIHVWGWANQWNQECSVADVRFLYFIRSFRELSLILKLHGRVSSFRLAFQWYNQIIRQIRHRLIRYAFCLWPYFPYR
ncbi:hypothetical protein FGO68_gene11361 [Halteria grandinella]|uniref:Uncharacterized protein n=1 Tax=Halteria grandinella TaxID=5974 RepID=A0A8J8NAV0_HALGN|nr:hypothetical protein FGO68_gene11361 [Halteria grandinella]